jgi:hypothetical protein
VDFWTLPLSLGEDRNKRHATAASLNNLAILYVEMGEYVKAEPLYLEDPATSPR